VVNQETVGVLFDGLANRRFAEVDGGCEPADVTRVADLQTVQRLGCVSDFLGDTEIVIEKTNQTV
jgi:hypothetical protein